MLQHMEHIVSINSTGIVSPHDWAKWWDGKEGFLKWPGLKEGGKLKTLSRIMEKTLLMEIVFQSHQRIVKTTCSYAADTTVDDWPLL